MRTHNGVGIQLQVFLAWALHGSAYFDLDTPCYPFDRKLDGLHSRYGRDGDRCFVLLIMCFVMILGK
jgi:hypothetical protein